MLQHGIMDRESLNDVRTDFVRDAKNLKAVTPEMERIFNIVADCLPLLQWLKKELKGEFLVTLMELSNKI